VYQSFVVPSLLLTQEVWKYDPPNHIWGQLLDCQEMIDTCYGERRHVITRTHRSTVGSRAVMQLFLAERDEKTVLIDDYIQNQMWRLLKFLDNLLQAGCRFPHSIHGKPLRLPVESTLPWLQTHIAAYKEAFIQDQQQTEFEIIKVYKILYGDKVIPPIYGHITRIAAVTKEHWNNIMDASSFVQEFINAAETRPGNEVGWYLTKLLIPPNRAVAAVLLRCHIGYSTAIKATDLEQDRICQQTVWLVLKKQCAYLLKLETRVELAKWLNAHVEKHEHDTNLAEISARANT
jgi:hypothetical protein